MEGTQPQPGSGSAVADASVVKLGSRTSGYVGSATWQAEHTHLPFGEHMYELKASSQTQ